MDLYLGEVGAEECSDMVSSAVDLWNMALAGFGGRTVSRIVSERNPRNFALANDFWARAEAESRIYLEDAQSVIYFKGGGDPDDVYSFARARSNRLNQLLATLHGSFPVVFFNRASRHAKRWLYLVYHPKFWTIL